MEYKYTYRRGFSVGEKLYIFFTVGVVIWALWLLGASVYRSYDKGAGEERVITATVTDKGVKSVDKSTQKYLVYTELDDGDDGVEVFEITDSLISGRFNSADVYAKIKVGKTYKFTVRGHRNGFFSWYPNIYDFEEVKEGAERVLETEVETE